MAEAKVLDKVEDIITCSLCREILNEPGTLLCLHSFCKGCVQSLELILDPDSAKDEDKKAIAPNQDDNELGADGKDPHGYSCPVCRRFTPKSDIRSVHIITQLLDAYHSSKTTSQDLCNTCNSKVAKWYCTECETDNSLCEVCKPLHDKWTKHKTQTLDEFKASTLLVEKTLYCEHHSAYKVDLYCTECDKITCVMCKILHHDGHKAEPIAEANQRLLPRVRERVAQIETNIEKNKEELTRLREEKKAMNKKYDMEIQDVEDKVSEARQVIKWVEAATTKTQGITLLKELQDGLLNKLDEMATATGGLYESTIMYASKCFPWSLNNIPSVLKQTINLKSPGGNHPFTRVAILFNHLWVFCHPTRQVFLVGFDGSQSGVIDLDSTITTPRTAVQVSKEHAILAAASGVYLISQHGQFITTLANGNFSDVCLCQDDGMIYALEHVEGVITSFKGSLSRWVKNSDIVLQNHKNEKSHNENNYVFSFLVSKGTIYLARLLNRRVAYYNMQGLEQKSVQNLNLPSICGISPKGELLICVVNEKKVVKIDNGGAIKVLFEPGNWVWHAVLQDEKTLWLLIDGGKLLKYCTA